MVHKARKSCEVCGTRKNVKPKLLVSRAEGGSPSTRDNILSICNSCRAVAKRVISNEKGNIVESIRLQSRKYLIARTKYASIALSEEYMKKQQKNANLMATINLLGDLVENHGADPNITMKVGRYLLLSEMLHVPDIIEFTTGNFDDFLENL